jgi:hypothetical protein
MPIQKIPFRPFDRIEVTDEPIVGNAGLKEGVAVDYTGVAGYAPVCSFLEGGIVAGARLCPGGQHPLQKGTDVARAGIYAFQRLDKSRRSTLCRCAALVPG